MGYKILTKLLSLGSNSRIWITPFCVAVASFTLILTTLALDYSFFGISEGTGPSILGLKGSFTGQPPPNFNQQVNSSGQLFLLSIIYTTFACLFFLGISSIIIFSRAFKVFGNYPFKYFSENKWISSSIHSFLFSLLYSTLFYKSLSSIHYPTPITYACTLILFLVTLFAFGGLLKELKNCSDPTTLLGHAEIKVAELIENSFSERLSKGAETHDFPAPIDLIEARGRKITASVKGYVKQINFNGLLAVAEENDLVLCIRVRPGEFVLDGAPLVTIPGIERLSPLVSRKIRELVPIDENPGSSQNISSAILELSRLGIRSYLAEQGDISSITTCIDKQTALLTAIASRDLPRTYWYDQHNSLRLIIRPFEFDDFVNAAFGELHRHTKNSSSISMYLLDALGVIAKFTKRQKDKDAVYRQAIKIERGSHTSLMEDEDQLDVEERFTAVMSTLFPNRAIKVTSNNEKSLPSDTIPPKFGSRE